MPGQCLFNALAALDPAFGEKLRESPSDPYFIDARPVGARHWGSCCLVVGHDAPCTASTFATAPEVPDA